MIIISGPWTSAWTRHIGNTDSIDSEITHKHYRVIVYYKCEFS